MSTTIDKSAAERVSKSSNGHPNALSEPAWDIAMLFPNQGHWNEDEYLALPSSRLVEYSFGHIEVVAMATRLHQAIVILMCTLLRAFTKRDPASGVLVAPFPVRLFEGKYREPDVFYMSGEHAHRQHETHWDGADLVVEVVSDDDRRRDLHTKRIEYAQAAIPEYWIIDPLKKEITVLSLAGTQYSVAGVYQIGERAGSALLVGFEVDVTEVFDAK